MHSEKIRKNFIVNNNINKKKFAYGLCPPNNQFAVHSKSDNGGKIEQN